MGVKRDDVEAAGVMGEDAENWGGGGEEWKGMICYGDP